MGNPVENFLKEAGFFSNMVEGMGGKQVGGFSGAIGSQIPTSVAAAAVTGAAMGVAKGYEAIRDRINKTRDFKNMLQATPDLRHFDAGHTQMMYNSLRMLAPTLARDPLVAGSFVRDALRLSPEHGPAIPPQTAKLLVETQAKMQGPSLVRQMADAAGKAGPMQRLQTERPEKPAPAWVEFEREEGGKPKAHRGRVPMEPADVKKHMGIK